VADMFNPQLFSFVLKSSRWRYKRQWAVRLFPSFFQLRLLLLLLDHRSRGVGCRWVERRFMFSRQAYPDTRHFD
jgi:hypothetical protein